MRSGVTVPKATRPRLLMVAHNHPSFFPGGAEILAYDLFCALHESGAYDTYFLAGMAASAGNAHMGTVMAALPGKTNEFLLAGGAFDHFLQSHPLAEPLHVGFGELLETLKPDVIHFHHTMQVGLETIAIARATLPNVKIIYTLHEFLLLCHHHGQMITPQRQLCERATPKRCHGCFPHLSPEQFLTREIFIRSHLSLVDQFVAPSHFLAKRFEAHFASWNMPRQVLVLENGRRACSLAPARSIAKGGSRNAFGYFGQITPFKGMDVLLDAVKLLQEEDTDFLLEIFGSIAIQDAGFQRMFHQRIEQAGDRVRFHGPYDNHQMSQLMAQVDWVIVPSIWWENSPLVIQEAFQHRRPVICSGIGGMAEKVEHERTGLHFAVGNADDLAAVMQRAMQDKGLWPRLVKHLSAPPTIEDCARKHLALYDTLLRVPATPRRRNKKAA